MPKSMLKLSCRTFIECYCLKAHRQKICLLKRFEIFQEISATVKFIHHPSVAVNHQIARSPDHQIALRRLFLFFLYQHNVTNIHNGIKRISDYENRVHLSKRVNQYQHTANNA